MKSTTLRSKPTNRVSDLRSVCPWPGNRTHQSPRAAAPGMERLRAVRLGAQGRCKNRARRRGARAPRNGDGHAGRHDDGGIREDRQHLDRHREASEDWTALRGDGLSTDDRGPRGSTHERLKTVIVSSGGIEFMRRGPSASMGSRQSKSSAAASRRNTKSATASQSSCACRS